MKAAIEHGIPTLAECGGFMYLTEAIETTQNQHYQMVGVIPGQIQMQTKLASLGYREVSGQNDNFLLQNKVARGHEFHYSTFKANEEVIPYAYETKGMRGVQRKATYSSFNSRLHALPLWFMSRNGGELD